MKVNANCKIFSGVQKNNVLYLGPCVASSQGGEDLIWYNPTMNENANRIHQCPLEISNHQCLRTLSCRYPASSNDMLDPTVSLILNLISLSDHRVKSEHSKGISVIIL